MSKNPSTWPWSVPLAVQDVPPEGKQQHLAADAEARVGVAKLAGVADVARLEAEIAAVPHGADGLRVTGRVSATVGQTCVVSLEPMQSEIEEPIDVLYLRNLPPGAADLGHLGEEPGKIGDERVEPLTNDTVDLGAIATEFVILGIDPYPRRPDATFSRPAAEKPSPGPFSALEALKKAGRGNGE